MTYRRTLEHRLAAQERIKRVQPSKSSTGPRTETGKAIVSRNAYRGGMRPALRELGRFLREQRMMCEETVRQFSDDGN